MANKQALRELQTRLAERLQAARTQEQGSEWLAVEAGGAGFLLPLREAGEISSVVPLQPVPYSQPWFLGVANLRGQLQGVVDLAAFVGLRSREPQREGAGRLVGFNPGLDLQCVLLVDRLAGLRSGDGMTEEPPEDTLPRPAFAGPRLRDPAGRTWQVLRLAELATDEAFLKIVG